jgi:hypothetical protein
LTWFASAHPGKELFCGNLRIALFTTIIWLPTPSLNYNPCTPEPSSVLLFGLGVVALAGMLRRKLF